MDNSMLHDMIFKRKSIRKYDITPLDDKVLAELSAYVAGLKPLDDTIKTEMKFVSSKDVYNLLPIKAPHYLIAFSEAKAGYLTNIGFMLQQLELFLSALGVGACWQGIPRPTSNIINNSSLPFVIVMSFGRAAEPLHRESLKAFKRKPVEAISNILGMRQLLEAARLAPSATNSQPWYFTGNDRVVHAYCVKTGFLKGLIYKKMNQIDMGIALLHLWLAAQIAGYEARYTQDAIGKDNPPIGYYYIGSFELSEGAGQ